MAIQTATKPSLTIKRRLKAAPAKVFAAWTEPEKIKRWFGPAGTVCTHAEFELRVGGKFTIVAARPGAEPFQVLGVVREVVPNVRLVYTWAWAGTPERESLVTVEFKPDGDGTLLTLMHAQFFDEEARDRHQQGWTGALDKLEKFVA
ncbi:MAG TPA: SRPBCC domain-containing protein [Xanthobacteraceae bacterium]|nr:SRPBCC domain-containing protein [Xanthobacteraceae bacterium]